MRDYWLGKLETLRAESKLNDNIDDKKTSDDICASSNVVTEMVTVGLEALRRRDDLHTKLVGTALAAAVAAGNSDEQKKKLKYVIEEMHAPEINYTVSTSSHSKMEEISIIDGALLIRGIIGWIDFFADAISGYNDNVDSLLDWMAGDAGGSVGKSTMLYLKLTTKSTIPDYVSLLKMKRRQWREERAARLGGEEEAAKVKMAEDEAFAEEIPLAEEVAKAAAEADAARVTEKTLLVDEAAKAKVAEEAKTAVVAEAARIAEETRLAEVASKAKEALEAAAEADSKRIAQENRLAKSSKEAKADITRGASTATDSVAKTEPPATTDWATMETLAMTESPRLTKDTDTLAETNVTTDIVTSILPSEGMSDDDIVPVTEEARIKNAFTEEELDEMHEIFEEVYGVVDEDLGLGKSAMKSTKK